MTFVMFGAGLILLMVGGELLVNGASNLARKLGMSPLLIGLTLVGFGTSSPELVASVQASLGGSPGIAVGNVVGSNISNLLFILGLTALVCPISISDRILRQDSRLMLAATALFVVVCFVFPLGRIVGGVLVTLLALYILYSFLTDRQSSSPEVPVVVPVKGGLILPALLALVGLGLVVFGGNLLVKAASEIARSYGVSETVIGLTIVAIGTSLPELTTSVIAALRKQPEIALGNVLGSNLYNILGIAGLTGIIAPTAVPRDIVVLHNPILLAATALTAWFLWSGRRVTRTEGFALISLYALYLISLLFFN